MDTNTLHHDRIGFDTTHGLECLKFLISLRNNACFACLFSHLTGKRRDTRTRCIGVKLLTCIFFLDKSLFCNNFGSHILPLYSSEIHRFISVFDEDFSFNNRNSRLVSLLRSFSKQHRCSQRAHREHINNERSTVFLGERRHKKSICLKHTLFWPKNHLFDL